MKVKMMATGAEFQVLECGYMLPFGLSPQQELCAGEVGYFTASIKNVHDTRVGDTVTENPTARRRAAARLPSGAPHGFLRHLY